jgi:hypothetical protein
MAIKISGTTVIDDSRQLNVSGINTLGTVKISSGIVTASAGIVTYYGDGQYLTGIAGGGGGGVLVVGGRVGVNTINVSSGSTTLLTRTGIATINV